MPGKDADAPTIPMPRKGFPSPETSPRDEAGSADSDAPLTPPSPWKWTIALALASAILMVAKPYVTAKPKNDAFVLSATDRNGRIQVRWDPNTTPVKSAQSAVLDVVDGNETHRYPVDAKVLHSGALDYVRNADDATVNLILMRDGQALAQSAVRSVGPVTALPQPPAVSATSHRSRRR
jgi:hypothetical protein